MQSLLLDNDEDKDGKKGRKNKGKSKKNKDKDRDRERNGKGDKREDTFEVDVNDNRFTAVFTDARFGIDRTHKR